MVCGNMGIPLILFFVNTSFNYGNYLLSNIGCQSQSPATSASEVA